MPLKFLYITNHPEVARIAEACGVEYIMVDLEILGKEERQRNRSSVISRHTLEDVQRIRGALTQAKLLVRVNPIHERSREEADQVLAAGADMLMLPYFKTPEEVEAFLQAVDGRAVTCLLWETVEAVERIEEILALPGIDRIHIGLNDLHIGRGMRFMFELLSDGTVELLCRRFKAAGIPYGFGGIARIGQGDLPAEHIIAEHVRLGSDMVILSRSFFTLRAGEAMEACMGEFRQGVEDIRAYEKILETKDAAYFEENHKIVQQKIAAIVDKNPQAGGGRRMKLLMTGALHLAKDQLHAIEALGYQTLWMQEERGLLPEGAEEAEAVVCNSLFLHQDIDRFKKLKFIQATSAGLDRIPQERVRERGIRLENAARIYSVPVAEWTVLKILELYKRSREFYRAQSDRQWKKQYLLPELAGKTALILGFGGIGREIARRLKAFDVRVMAVKKHQASGADIDLADSLHGLEEIDSLLPACDILILALPYEAASHHLINAERLGKMKEDSVLVNVARGGILDEQALAKALDSGKFLGAVLDVFEEEPLSPVSPLWKMDNLIITPHNAYASDRADERLFQLVLKNLAEYAEGRKNEKE